MTDFHAVKFGEPMSRREDDRLVQGRGCYVDDTHEPGELIAVFVRSNYASAKLLGIDASTALAHPGVVAVLTGADLKADGVDVHSAPFKLQQPDGTQAVSTPRPLLVDGRVRFVGEPVAMVIAQSLQAAIDASELVLVDYETLEAVIDRESATRAGAPSVWPDRAGNVAFRWQKGDQPACEKVMEASHHVTRLDFRISRVSAMPLEPRGAVAFPDERGRTVLRLAHQSPHLMRNELAAMFGIGRDEVRVLVGDVGGSFGMKSGVLREEAAIYWAARRLKKRIRWMATRSESLLGDDQARDLDITAALGLDAQGRFTCLHVRYELNIGAYMSWRSTVALANFGGIAGVYTTPVIIGEANGYFSNTPPTAAYRGAGRPEATYAVERLIDVAAQEIGMDPVELRRRNLIPPSAMPYQTPFIFQYDCGEFERNMDRALSLSRYSDFPARREASRRAGKLRGIGIANPIEVAGGPYAKPAPDWSEIRAHADGTVTLAAGAMSVGQGHETSLPQLVAQRLGIAPESVRYVQGDTDAIANGKGNGGSGGLILGGTAASLSVDDLIDKARHLAARELEASVHDIEYAAGVFRVAGSDLTITLGDVASTAEQGGASLLGAGQFALSQSTFPNGCHICEVEVDPDTGAVEVVGYTSVEDVGRVMNPKLVEGQIHGGVAQGIGQALMEQICYDETGQLLTGSFMDYAMPRASDMPAMRGENPETPTPLNPLGVKGVGEAGTVGALAATMNAVCHALQPAGVRHIDMPATPLRVWTALMEARSM